MKTRRAVSAILTGIVVMLLLGDALLVFVPKMLGYNCFAVSGGSMEPTISQGSLVFTQEADFSEIQPGDILTFRDQKGEAHFTHRVVAIDTETGLLTTRGDANAYDDPAPADYNHAVGKVVRSVPFLGYIHLGLTSSWGIAVVLALLVLWFGVQLYFVRRKNREKT